IKRAGLVAWPKLFANMRASRATELTEEFQPHVCSAWMGHTEQIARKHYQQVTENHFEQAILYKPEKMSRFCRGDALPSDAESPDGIDKMPYFQGSAVTGNCGQLNEWAVLDSNQ
ncbi:MAG: hypothetical protein O2955_21605, partial [Planctomycetota bacterium]|nr:hypothetical protein [Planctomycetota bacterium]